MSEELAYWLGDRAGNRIRTGEVSSREALDRPARPGRAARRAGQQRGHDRRRAGLRRGGAAPTRPRPGLGTRAAARRADDDQGLVADRGHAHHLGRARAGRPRAGRGRLARRAAAGGRRGRSSARPTCRSTPATSRATTRSSARPTTPTTSTRTPGGSSGGSAAALACGFTPLELGSDIGGSIRLPSHMSGVMGHKPSYGIVPAHGQIPGPPGTLTQADLAVAGPDGPHGRRPRARPRRSWPGPTAGTARRGGSSCRRPADHELAGYRIAAWLDDERCPVEPEVAALLERAARGPRPRRAPRSTPRPGPASRWRRSPTRSSALLARGAGGRVPPATASSSFAADDRRLAARRSTRRRTAMRHRDWLSPTSAGCRCGGAGRSSSSASTSCCCR